MLSSVYNVSLCNPYGVVCSLKYIGVWMRMNVLCTMYNVYIDIRIHMYICNVPSSCVVDISHIMSFRNVYPIYDVCVLMCHVVY